MYVSRVRSVLKRSVDKTIYLLLLQVLYYVLDMDRIDETNKPPIQCANKLIGTQAKF